MKKLIFLLLVISVTALTAQNYQYFTAKQGIPKAMEIAKTYFQSDSVKLYEIKCSRWHYFYGREIVVYDSIHSLNESTGRSIYWYYNICNSKDSCYDFRVWNNEGIYEFDSVFINYMGYNFEYSHPLIEDEILVDTDSLVKCIDSLRFIDPIFFRFRLYYSILFYHEGGFPNAGEQPLWEYFEPYIYDTSALLVWLSSNTCEYYVGALDVFERNNKTNSLFNIKSDPNTDILIIELNSDLFKEAELSLYDQVGVLLFADKLNNKSYELSTYNYPSGLYILQIKYGGNVLTKTVMIVH